MNFHLQTPFFLAGDQAQAIEKLVSGLKKGLKHQVLLGVTGSGKTFTMAHTIAALGRPTLIISHNKTLAAQLYQEFKVFFPDNAVSYFVSYYDYYQPESYLPQTDTYIEKETEINEQIDKLRLAATTNLLTRRDTIIVASVSCIYNIGSPREYGHFVLQLEPGLNITRRVLFQRFTQLHYERSDCGFRRGTFRVRGETIDLFPAYQDSAVRIEFAGEKIATLSQINVLDGSKKKNLPGIVIYPAKHYMTDPKRYQDVFSQIRKDLKHEVDFFRKKAKVVEAHRLQQRVNFDLEMIEEIGFVNGIENYSRYFDGRKPGDPPYTLLDYFEEAVKGQAVKGQTFRASRSDPGKDPGKGWLLFIDESHMTVPQIRGMYHGDRSRKQTLIDYGFRLQAAIDNRPLTFDEFLRRIPQTIYVSATPDEWEVSLSKEEAHRLNQESTIKNQGKKAHDSYFMIHDSGIVEQLIRPTGLIDPQISVRPTTGQIADLLKEILERKKRGERVLVTTLTKRMAEDLAQYFAQTTADTLLKVHYLHSDIETLKRSDILDDLRLGKYDVLIGINLLREGLDLPEVSLVAILDADKEGFLRSTTSLIQTMGRAARHLNGEVIMYADTVTGSMKRAIEEVGRRREIQLAYNKSHAITPRSVSKAIRDKLVEHKEQPELEPLWKQSSDSLDELLPEDKKKRLAHLRRLMRQAAVDLNFELAAEIRDQLLSLEKPDRI